MALAVTSREVGPERYELTVTATPTAAVDRLELGLVLPPGAVIERTDKGGFGATPRGQQRVLTATVATRPGELAATARVPVEGIEMVKTTPITLGEPSPQARTIVYATPDGELAREVRP